MSIHCIGKYHIERGKVMARKQITVECYLNGEKIDTVPPKAAQAMMDRLSAVMSRYYSLHPEEYLALGEGDII